MKSQVSDSGHIAEIRLPRHWLAYAQLPNLKRHQDSRDNMDMETLLVPGGWPKAGREGKGGTVADSH